MWQEIEPFSSPPLLLALSLLPSKRVQFVFCKATSQNVLFSVWQHEVGQKCGFQSWPMGCVLTIRTLIPYAVAGCLCHHICHSLYAQVLFCVGLLLANSFFLWMGVQRTPGTVKPAMAFNCIPWRCTRWVSLIMGGLHILDQLVCVGGRSKEGKYPKRAMPR